MHHQIANAKALSQEHFRNSEAVDRVGVEPPKLKIVEVEVKKIYPDHIRPCTALNNFVINVSKVSFE